MHRRTLLAAGASITLAGCIGGASGGPAAVEESQEDGGVALTVEQAFLANDLTTDTDQKYNPQPDHRFAFLEVVSRNTADEIVDLARRSELRLIIDESQYEPIELNDVVSEALGTTVEGFQEPVEGGLYESVEDARPDVSTDGWIVFHIPSDTPTARLSWARRMEQEEPLYWELNFSPEELPDIQIVDVSTPSTLERHETVPVEIRLENQGGSRGEFDRSLTIYPTEEEVPVSTSVEAGSSTTEVIEVDHPVDGFDLVAEARFEIADHSSTVSFEIPTRQLGDAYTTPGGLSITVEEFRPVESAEREGGFDTISYEPDAGEQLALVRIHVSNDDSTTRIPPGDSSFQVVGSEGDVRETYVEYPGFSSSDPFINPINADAYVDDDLAEGDETEGWILISYPDDVDRDSARLRWERGTFNENENEPTDLMAEWSLRR